MHTLGPSEQHAWPLNSALCVNNKMKENKVFIPRDKPKSFVIGILSCLVGLFVAGPILIAGKYYEINLIEIIGQFMFISCWVLFATSWLIFIFGLTNGKYKNLEEKEWSEQLW